MKEIILTQNKIAIVDDKEYEFLNQFKWYATRYGQKWYVWRKSPVLAGKRSTIFLHREIMNAPKGQIIDHINGNPLDNRKENMRFCTRQQNQFNRNAQKNNKLGVKGVSKCKKSKKFMIRIYIKGKQIYLGLFETLDNADIAYRCAEVKYFGEFARESSKRYVKILSSEYQISLAG